MSPSEAADLLARYLGAARQFPSVVPELRSRAKAAAGAARRSQTQPPSEPPPSMARLSASALSLLRTADVRSPHGRARLGGGEGRKERSGTRSWRLGTDVAVVRVDFDSTVTKGDEQRELGPMRLADGDQFELCRVSTACTV